MEWHPRAAVGLAFVTCLGVWAAPCGANGMFVSHEMAVMTRAGSSGASAAQIGIIIREAGDEVLLLRTTYRGPSGDFAWVIPVPRAPDGPDGVFTASNEFIDTALLQSKPRLTLVTGSDTAGKAMAKGAALRQARQAGVQVLSRRQVGDYDASVLAARDARALTDWLKQNGYKLPANAGPVVADYIRRRWVFVAMRVLDWVQEQKPVLDSVTPVGIRFQTEPLVFPLAISKVSAPETTSVLLLVYDRGPVRCRELPIRYAEPQVAIPCGESYERIREQLAADPEPALLCEAVGPGVAGPYGSYRSEGGARQTYDGSNQKLWVSRLWARIDRDDMVDLTFDPDRGPREPYRLAIEIGAPGTVLAGLPGGARSSALGSGSARETERLGPSRAAYVALPLALIVLAVILRSRRGLGPIAALALAASLGLPGHLRAGPSGRSVPQWVTLLGQAQEAIEEAVKAFTADTGCYPASLADLTLGEQVTRGLDASGNLVRLMVRPTRAYLAELPVDVLTQRSDTWLMSVAGGAVVQSGGLEGVVKREPAYGRRDAKSRGWNDPEYPVGQVHVRSGRDGSLPERTDSAPETRSFWASEVVREGRFAAITSLAGDKPWGVVAVGRDEAAVLLRSGMTPPAGPAPGLLPEDAGYVRAVRNGLGWGIQQGGGGRYELVRLRDRNQDGEPPKPSLSDVSPDVLILAASQAAVAVRRSDDPALVLVPRFGTLPVATLLPIPRGFRLTQCIALGHASTTDSLAAVLEPERGVGLGEIWRIDRLLNVPEGRASSRPRLVARFHCEAGRTRLMLPAGNGNELAAVWIVPDSRQAAVRVTDLSGEAPRWLPVTTLPPEEGWDLRAYERARRWIERNAADSEVPVLPL